ncbi:MAG TPA: ATP synthase F1 subunit delta [Geobacteraceae bacterium]|nr:ATP synthase F1 subunit delta [Geobacteraceae bacterium]
MITNAIARRYAKALVQLAIEEGGVEKIHAELTAFDALLVDNRNLWAILVSPAYRIEAKREMMRELIAKMELSATVKNFLLLVLEKNRLNYLPQIVVSYGMLADELSGVVRPTLTSAMPLDAGQVEEIKETLAKYTGKRVILKVEVDPALIGGVVTRIGDMAFDGSLKTQLTRIGDILQKG